MTLVIILGPSAVGKMTVGQALAEHTGLRLLHNHMTIELVRNFFSVHGSEQGRYLNNLFRQEIFKAVAESDLPGLIFTYMFCFDDKNEYNYINNLIDLYKSNGAKTCVVELYADPETRLMRNKTENRLLNKLSKRNLEYSEKLLIECDSNYRLNSRKDEKPFDNYLKIDNTNLSPETAADMIIKHFGI